MQRGAAHELNVVVALSEHPLGGFTHDGEGVDQEIVDLDTLLELGPELTRLGPERVVAQRLHLGFEGVDVGHQGLKGLELAPFATSQHTLEHTHDPVRSLPIRFPCQGSTTRVRTAKSTASVRECR